MAIKMPALNIGFGKSKPAFKAPAKPPLKVQQPATVAGGAAAPAAKKPRGEGGLFAGMPVVRQLQVLGAAFLFFVAVIALMVFVDAQTATRGTAYVQAAGDMRTLSQQLAKSAQQGLQGNPAAFGELKSSRDRFAELLETLRKGGQIGDVAVPPVSEAITPILDKTAKLWEKTEKDATLVLNQQKNLVALGTAVKQINANNPALLDLAEQVSALKLQTQSGAREISAAGELVMLTQRMAKNANALLAADTVDPETSFLLGKDTNTFRQTLQALMKGSEQLRLRAATDPETLDTLVRLEGAYKEFQTSVSSILSNIQPLVAAKNAARSVAGDSDKLLATTTELSTAFNVELESRAWNFIVIAVFSLLAAATVALGIVVFLGDARRRREEAESSKGEAERTNKQNQEAILRLMNEMGSLADGDLTVRATVTEDITGAIADSVNYTIEELRVLVGRINSAAAQVTTATESAQQTSVKLLQAAEKQSREIQETSSQVLKMARAINDVSASASRSVSVARQSLSAAEKGTEAVSNSISGMNEIRDQIQDTAKRIKRLGESSQEIGEIVELISDITEQTNVLALNAAIQAASAGEAGRGFTVVAEEVQRLAERSGEATKQIAAIVKTIQTDTQDAVAAMEKSTQGVVEGAKLSDAAGQALSEIGEVSRRLAQLIEEISVTAQTQAQAAGTVATSMQDILNITKQTTEGTKQTAVSIGQLARLAQELKGSVANFKI
ncbi:MAG: methyl-accepting chemotaxis protein [Burkholderiales bacterium]|jgi:twitching motility protein PilJ|nr:methyl-accepting chemotaxis protein [Burkholderiales bacterium]